MFKSIICCLCAVVLPFVPCFKLEHKKSAYAEAQAEISMELSTGTVLTEHNSTEQLPMASTTKILTAIIIIEDCNLDEVITVPDEAVGVEGSSIYLCKGEQINIKDLLYGLMLRSGNDSAAALAIHHSGNTQNFVKVMNTRAKEIGAAHSNFTNPSGLPDADHYTTAYDLCKIACYAMSNETFKNIVSTKNYRGEYRSFANKNKMLSNYEGANGIKTGYTVKAGRCLVSSAVKNGMDVVCVVLNCPEMYERSTELLDYCFKEYKLNKIDKTRTFFFGGRIFRTENEIQFVTRSNAQIEYQITTENKSKGRGKDCVQLEIYAEKKLLFTEKLYSI